MSKKLVTTNAFTLQETTIGNCFRYEIDGFQIVFGTSQITAGWEKEVYIPFSFSEAPGDCYIHWIAIGKH